MNEANAILTDAAPYLPYLLTAVSGAIGTLGAIIAYFWVNKLRLTKIEYALGRRILSGDRRIATTHVMEICKGEIVDLIEKHEEKLESHIRAGDLLFERIEEKVDHTNDQILEIFKILASWPRGKGGG